MDSVQNASIWNFWFFVASERINVFVPNEIVSALHRQVLFMYIMIYYTKMPECSGFVASRNLL